MLSPFFTFSQSSLQDYVDCPRRFQLRYVERQVWPGAQAEPLFAYEQHLARGERFHRLVERHQLGMSAELLERGLADDDTLCGWWEAYKNYGELHALAGQRYPEYTLSVDVAGARLVAKYDLLVVDPGQGMVIFDWKTYDRVPTRIWLESRLQTRVYRAVLMGVGQRLFGAEFVPDQVRMVYWIAGAAVAMELVYSQAQYDQDVVFLAGLLAEIKLRDGEQVWSLAFDERQCRFCSYRSLCDRGAVAGPVEDSNYFDNIAGGGVFEDFGLLDVEEFGF